MSSRVLSPSPLARSLVFRAGFALALVTASACANSDKPATPEPDKSKVAQSNAKSDAKVAEEKAAEAKRAEEKAAADKAAAEKADAEKAAAKEADAKPADSAQSEAKAKAPGDDAKEVAAVAPKSTTAPKAGAVKPTKIESKTGILAKGEADKYAKAGGRPVVRLLDAGAEPRSTAVYAIVKGPTKPLQMGMDLEMAMEAGGMKLPATKMPRMNLIFNFSTGDRAGVEWPIDGKLSKITVEPKGAAQEQIAAALRPQLGSLEGIAMNYFVDERGNIHDVKVTLPPSLPPMAGQMMSGMTQSIESMTSPLPSEPIGIGAKWEVLSRIVANGADLLQVSTLTLEKRESNALTIDAVVRQYGAKDAVNPPGMPPGATARLLSYNCQGGGKPIFDMTDVAPTGGSMSINSTMTIELKMDVEGKSEKQSTSVDTKMTAIYSRPTP